LTGFVIPTASAAATQDAIPVGLKINIGSGLSGMTGWHNLDNSPTILLARLPLGRRLFHTPDWPDDVVRHDVKRGLPFPDNSAACIYSSHTFEHFTWEESLTVAKECFRVLRQDGALRIAVPDLGRIVREYLKDPDTMASHHFLARLSLARSLRDWIHPGANHAQMFDERSLTHLLREAGFAAAQVMPFRESRISDIADLELDVRKSESLYVEAAK
jgi:predicted SAM-dependent methyltransferase